MVAPKEELSLIQQKNITDINKLSYTNQFLHHISRNLVCIIYLATGFIQCDS